MKMTSMVTILFYVLRYLPLILDLVGKIRETFNSEKIPEVIRAFNELIDKIAPPAPTAESSGEIPANPIGEKKKRFGRLKNRLDIAGTISEYDAREFCKTHFASQNPYV